MGKISGKKKKDVITVTNPLAEDANSEEDSDNDGNHGSVVAHTPGEETVA